MDSISNFDNQFRHFKLEEGFVYVAKVDVDSIRQIASFDGSIWKEEVCLMEFKTQLAGGFAKVANEQALRRFIWGRVNKDILRKLNDERKQLPE